MFTKFFSIVSLLSIVMFCGGCLKTGEYARGNQGYGYDGFGYGRAGTGGHAGFWGHNEMQSGRFDYFNRNGVINHTVYNHYETSLRASASFSARSGLNDPRVAAREHSWSYTQASKPTGKKGKK